MGKHPNGEEELARTTAFLGAFNIPTDNMIARPEIQLSEQGLRISPEFYWSVDDLTGEQLDAIETTMGVRLQRS